MVVGLIAPAFLPECTLSWRPMVATIPANKLADTERRTVPETARFLNDREKHIALTRVHLNQAKQQFEHATIRQSLRMLLDWKILVL